MEEKQIQKDDEINLLDYFIVLLKRKKLIMASTLACAVITAIISLIIPKIYNSQASILPPQQSASVTSQIISQFAAGGLSSSLSGILGTGSSSDLYVGMLQSRTIMDNIIKRFDLMKLYKEDNLVDARDDLSDNIEVKSDSKSNIITISVEDKDPKRAADMANAFVEELKNLNKGLAVTEAAQRRLFFEEQLKDTKMALVKAEDEMKGFEEKTGALQVEEQAKAVIEAIAILRAQIAAKEVEIRVMRTYSTPNNPDLQMAEETLRGLKNESSKLEAKGGSGFDPFMSTGRMPAVGTEYMRKLRDVTFNATLFELLAKQYEMAKLDEARDATVIQVVDKAIPPDKRAKPKRTLIVLIATFSGFFLSIFAAFFMEYIENSSTDLGNKKRLETIKKYLTFRLKVK